MKSPHGARWRALPAAAAATLATGLLTAAPASAHVHADADNPTPGSTSLVTFQVPGESDTGALTTQLSVALPNVASARAEVMPGWTAKLDRDTAAGTVRSVTWTAAPGVGISPDQFALFRISVKLPTTPTVSFPATQTYSDGKVVHWDQAPLPGGGEPEYPAPELKLSGAPAGDDHDDDHGAAPSVTATAQPPASAAPAAATADNTARWLAGGALAVAAVAVVAALAARRRS
ncbi:YcnI family protein [Mycolicibacterium brisbanense]|uniref:Nuclear export factor GLE1 family protein n=1 Tax=Mycolicibacterium brisbanense TaxID=146020 RepID=A0A100W3E3_9MYCO|nr:YcnI family protein [Mycolicibacterium brisbanense]MCV7158327.1 YcnI family protein [Mycolicibacterium brisbanense]GAS90925.1 nuclear export factor GLE1 family protein [Mycolicibacterium brisbanense]